MLGNIVELATVLDHQKEFLLAAAHGIPHTYGTVLNFEVGPMCVAFVGRLLTGSCADRIDSEDFRSN